MFDDILLEPEQKQLLIVIVEIARSIPKDKRQKFPSFKSSSGQSWIKHRAIPDWDHECYEGDLEILISRGLLNPSYGGNGLSGFDVTPEGFQYYEYLKKQAGEPLNVIDDTVRNHLFSFDFQRKYPDAFHKWQQAEILLWSTDSNEKLTAIGHHCRESVQEFASALVRKFPQANADPNPIHQIARVKAVIEHVKETINSSLPSFLNALIAYWGELSDLIQRQEHGAQKEGNSLVWEDARRLVFHTAITIYEIDQALSLRAK